MTLYRTNEPHAEEIHDLIDIGMLVEVEPTDRICTMHGLFDHAGATLCDGDGSFESWHDCNMVDVVRVPKAGTGYPQGAVTRAAELQAEDADPELHHHEVSHSHPFENLGHTHDQPRMDDNEKEGNDG